MRAVNLEPYGKLADKVAAILNGEDLRILTAEEAYKIADISWDYNDVPVLWVLAPFTDDDVTDQDLDEWRKA